MNKLSIMTTATCPYCKGGDAIVETHHDAIMDCEFLSTEETLARCGVCEKAVVVRVFFDKKVQVIKAEDINDD